jgi:hypothetical protein
MKTSNAIFLFLNLTSNYSSFRRGTILLCVGTLNRCAYCLQEVVEYSCTGPGVSVEVMLIQVEITDFEWIDLYPRELYKP